MSVPHPLRCHPPSPTPGDDRPLDEEFETPVTTPELTWSTTIPTSDSEEGDDVETSIVEFQLTSLQISTPRPRAAPRFVDLFGRDSVNGQTRNMIEDAVRRVFSHLPRKYDQRTLTFVDRSTMSLLLPELYHTVSIDLSKYPYNLAIVMNMLAPNNVGRDFIKHVIFDDTNITDITLPPSGLHYLASVVIERVPKYQLERFDWPADFTFPNPYSLHLFDNQDNLKNIAIDDSTLNVRGGERKEMINALDRLEAVRVSPDNKAALRNVHHLFRRHNIKELHVDLRTYQPPEVDLDYNTIDAPTKEIVEALFTHIQPLSACPKKFQLGLTRLVLWNVNLYRSADTWYKVLKPLTLQELEISECPWAGNLLTAVGRSQPSLRKVVIDHDTRLDIVAFAPANEKHGLWFWKSLKLFLEELAESPWGHGNKTGLKYLEIYVPDACNFHGEWDDDGLRLLTPTLEVLSLNFVPTDGENTPYCEGIPAALNACKVSFLRQLCIPHMAWTLRDVPMIDTDDGSIIEPLDLQNINPVTLCLVMWQDEMAQLKTSALSIANQALNDLRTVHEMRTRLRVVAISDDEGAEYFVKCDVTKMGKTVEMMLPATYNEVRAFELEVDILKPSPAAIGKHGRV